MKTIKAILFIIPLIASAAFSKTSEQEIGQLYFQKKYEQVLKLSKALLKEKRNESTANLMVGRVFVDQGKFDLGMPYLENAISIDKQNSWRTAWALHYLG